MHPPQKNTQKKNKKKTLVHSIQNVSYQLKLYLITVLLFTLVA